MAPTRRNKRKPIIPLLPSQEEKDHKPEYVKHSRSSTDNNNVTESIEERVPIIGDESTPRQLLDFLARFQQARRSLHWTTGPKLFQKFPTHLTGIQVDNRNQAIHGLNATEDNFEAAIITFKNTSLAGFSYHDQMDFIRSLR